MSCFSLSCAVKPQKDSDDATISAEARTRTERDRQTHTHTRVEDKNQTKNMHPATNDGCRMQL